MFLCLLINSAYAFDNKDWGHDPETSMWFKSLRNSNNEGCCDYADGVRIEDPEWRQLEDETYEVFAHNKWNKINPNYVLRGTNRVGYPILWWPPGLDHPTCFLPGARG